jgi:hypothetical protein
MAGLIYMLCALTALLCAGLLLQTYRNTKYKLLLWGGLCFSFLTLNNVILVIDKVFMADVDLYALRLGSGLIAISILLYGLIWDAE